MKVNSEFVLEAHKYACKEWKMRIEGEFPKLFKDHVFEEGKWYVYKKGAGGFGLFNYQGVSSYGLGSCGYWSTQLQTGDIDKSLYKLADDNYVLEELTREAYKRGLVKGTTCRSLNHFHYEKVILGNWVVTPDGNLGEQGESGCFFYIMYNGEWLEPRETISLKEAEEKLNKTIII